MKTKTGTLGQRTVCEASRLTVIKVAMSSSLKRSRLLLLLCLILARLCGISGRGYDEHFPPVARQGEVLKSLFQYANVVNVSKFRHQMFHKVRRS